MSKDKEEKEQVSISGFIFLNEQVKSLTKRVGELEKVLSDVVHHLEYLGQENAQPQEKTPEFVPSQPEPKQSKFSLFGR